MFELKYGNGGSLQLDLPPAAILANYAAPRGVPLSDPAAAVAAALSDPLDFPPLRQATVPGDRVVIALDRGVPQLEQLVAGIVHSLMEGPCEPHEICLVSAESEAEADPAAALPRPLREQVEVSRHDPHDVEGLCYLAASREGKPIYLNRRICEADVVIPVSTLRLEQVFGYLGVHGGLFPTFSDEATRRRFRVSSPRSWEANQQQRREEVEEAAWLLGVQFTVQVAPGPGSSILHVLAGDARAVSQQGRRYCEAAWMHQPPARADLVVATIEGGPEQQTWENFSRALFAASQAVQEGGAILLCTDLRCQPSPALRRLAGVDEQQLPKALRRDRSGDALPASLLAETRQRNRVYLLSGLDSETVEEMGIGHVTSLADVQRLSERCGSCILLGNAQHAVLSAGPN